MICGQILIISTRHDLRWQEDDLGRTPFQDHVRSPREFCRPVGLQHESNCTHLVIALNISRMSICTYVRAAGWELTCFEMMQEVPHIVHSAFRQITGLFNTEIVSSPALRTYSTMCGTAGRRKAQNPGHQGHCYRTVVILSLTKTWQSRSTVQATRSSCVQRYR
jgi:hypothetical protein